MWDEVGVSGGVAGRRPFSGDAPRARLVVLGDADGVVEAEDDAEEGHEVSDSEETRVSGMLEWEEEDS